jgi:2-methylcitrate dehydratase PrpD
MSEMATHQTSDARARSVAEELSAFASAVTYEMLPARTVEFAKALVCKTLAGALGGSQTASAKSVAKLVRERALPPEAGVIGYSFRTSLWDAALTNVFTAHSSELEDVAHSPGGVSWDITIIPLALSLAERLRLSGRALIETIAVGLETHYRTCLPFDATPIGMVLPPTAAMGCAAAAAKAYGLSEEQTTAALGFALSCAAPAEVSMGTDAHFFESALHAFQGLVGAELARVGLTGNPDIDSFARLKAPGVALEDALVGLYERWYFEEMWIKKYPVCFLVHRQLDALIEICEQEGLTDDEIERIEVYTGPGDASCDRPHPRTVGDLQFSFQHALAAAALNGGVGLGDLEPAAASDPRYLRARAKVKVLIDRDLPFSVSLSEPTTVLVRTTDGREFTRERLTARGSPQEPLTRADFVGLYRQFAAGPLGEAALERTVEMIWALDLLPEVGELMDAVTFVEGRA